MDGHSERQTAVSSSAPIPYCGYTPTWEESSYGTVNISGKRGIGRGRRRWGQRNLHKIKNCGVLCREEGHGTRLGRVMSSRAERLVSVCLFARGTQYNGRDSEDPFVQPTLLSPDCARGRRRNGGEQETNGNLFRNVIKANKARGESVNYGIR